jgi:AcrR family transcriptional regulator
MPPANRRHRPRAKPENSARIARRERRRDRSREEILEAARRVLLRDGIAATTLDAVAKEVGVSKTALYYYFPSKDALFFELVFGVLDSQAKAVHDAVENANDGTDALRTVIRESVQAFAPRLDDFRLAFLHGQVAAKGAVHFNSEQFARIRPLNDLWYAGATQKLREERKKRPGRAQVEPRLMAFLAHLAAIGLLTMKGMVESVNDPLLYSDEQLIEGFGRIFEAAAAP